MFDVVHCFTVTDLLRPVCHIVCHVDAKLTLTCPLFGVKSFLARFCYWAFEQKVVGKFNLSQPRESEVT
jgi:hypothetical protein